MKERPILFSGPMVRAILEGRKTQTRRAVKLGRFPESTWKLTPVAGGLHRTSHDGIVLSVPSGGLSKSMQDAIIRSPYGQPGDRLWVRETWAPHADDGQCFVNYETRRKGNGEISEPGHVRPEIFYRADGGDPFINNWRPSIHMPRWASRITLEVTEVRVQRLQELSEEDAQREGVEYVPRGLWRDYRLSSATEDDFHILLPRRSFMSLWDSINGEHPGRFWDANPWMWAISFKVVE